MKNRLLIAGAVLVLSGGGFLFVKARGIRNKNPGNIELGENWLGMSEAQTDARFIQFDKAVYGIRAINRILKTYQNKHGIKTVRGVINRWAPPKNDRGQVENDTESYVLSVAKKLSVGPDDEIMLGRHARLFTAAIIRHENGIQPYSATVINEGVQMGWA